MVAADSPGAEVDGASGERRASKRRTECGVVFSLLASPLRQGSLGRLRIANAGLHMDAVLLELREPRLVASYAETQESAV